MWDSPATKHVPKHKKPPYNNKMGGNHCIMADTYPFIQDTIHTY